MYKYTFEDTLVGQDGSAAWEWYISVYHIAVAMATAAEIST